MEVHSAPETAGSKGPNKQHVMAFTMKDWDALKKAYNLKEAHVPSRKMGKGSDYTDPLADIEREANN